MTCSWWSEKYPPKNPVREFLLRHYCMPDYFSVPVFGTWAEGFFTVDQARLIEGPHKYNRAGPFKMYFDNADQWSTAKLWKEHCSRRAYRAAWAVREAIFG